MTRTTVTRTIQAPTHRVFDTIAHIQNFAKAVPAIQKVEILSEVQSGVGTRFRETRLMKGREAVEEMEVTEYVENERIRIVCDSHGTVWDTLFTVASDGERTTLELVMDARAQKLLPKLMTPLLKGFLQRALESDMDSVKAYCEAGGSGPSASGAW